VLLVVGLAVFEWRVRAGRGARPGVRLVFPILCAAGGALLLTHSHAMLGLRSEFLAEVSHAPMGILAVLMGWARWIELRLPAPARPGAGRPDPRSAAGWTWATSLAFIGVILLVYREA
jgi:copper resistance protein D